MFSVSIKSENSSDDILAKTGNNIVNFIKDNLEKKSLVILKDENAINIISGNINSDVKSLTAEISFKYQISISEDEIKNKESLDKFIFYIKNCLDNISSIEDIKYIPIEHRRDKK
jgi:hypothetical protein